MRLYDLSIILHPHITDVELPSAIETIRKEIQTLGARELQEEQIGKQRLGHQIQGNRFGHIIYFRFESETQNANLLIQKLNLQPNVIRSMLSLVRHGLPFKPAHKPLRRFGTRGAQTASFDSAPIGLSTSRLKTETAPPQSSLETAPKPAPADLPKIDLAEIDKRIDDLINKETF